MKRTSQPSRVLLVEDDPEHGLFIRQAIEGERRRVAVETVSSDEACLRRFRAGRYECIVIDINLQDGAAESLLREVKLLAPEAPVIVVSSCADQSVVIQCLRNGITDFIPKWEALTSDVLCPRIERAIADRRKSACERRRAERRVRRLMHCADRDPLTGLYNRWYFGRWLAGTRRTKYDRRGLASAIMFDLDDFKRINDRYGHARGDDVLRAAARTIETWLRCGDMAFRWGGEEFLVFQPRTNLAASMRWVEMVRREMARSSVLHEGRRIKFTASVGIYNGRSDAFDGRSIDKADAAMYLSKREGRNRTSTWEVQAFKELIDSHGSWGASITDKLRTVLAEYWHELGPTQQEHLTSHSRDVSKIAVRLGTALGLANERLRELGVAGLCHDLGKIGVPESLLAKADPLTREERHLVVRQAGEGAMMASWLGIEPAVAETIRRVHERYDTRSSTALDNVAGATLNGRILAAADALAAMTSDRPHQPKRTVDDALKELEKERGRQFDPAIVDAAKRCLRSLIVRPYGGLATESRLPSPATQMDCAAIGDVEHQVRCRTAP